MPFITVKKSVIKGRWVLVDSKGRLHSNALTSKARAQHQADQMNAKLAEVKKGFAR
jgi:hypothetical protein